MFNGNTLKVCFTMIVATLCIIIIGLTIGAAFFGLKIESYEALLGVLGVSTLFSGISQAFIHSNQNDGGSNVQSDSTILSKPVQESSAPKV